MIHIISINKHCLYPGEYCDIIHDCEQKIQISGGRGYFKAAQENDPVVAICVGCQ